MGISQGDQPRVSQVKEGALPLPGLLTYVGGGDLKAADKFAPNRYEMLCWRQQDSSVNGRSLLLSQKT